MSCRVLMHAFCAAAVLASLAGCGGGKPGKSPGAADANVVVFAAASATNALDEIIAEFQRETGRTVQTSYAGTSTLAQQIIHGAGADVFVSADKAWAAELQKKGLVAKEQDLVGNRLVIIVQADSDLAISSPEDLLTQPIHRLALADPASVPAGRYAHQALVKLGMWKQLEPRVVASADVRQALAYVATTAAEAGIVYASDASASKAVKVAAEIPADLTDPIIFPAVLLKHGAGNAAAEAFYERLLSEKSTEVFLKHGFTGLPK